MNKTTEALKLAELVEASAEEYMGEDGMVMVIPLDLYNDLIGALAAIREVLAEPVKQEPVYAFRRRGLNDFCTCTKERYEELAGMPNLFEVTTFYAAPVQPVKQESVAVVEITYGREPECYVTGNIDDFPEGVFKLYAAPVSVEVEWVDLTEGEQEAIYLKCNTPSEYTKAVIAAFKEKNE